MLNLTKITHLEGTTSKPWLDLIRKDNMSDPTAKSNNDQEYLMCQ